MSTDAPAMLWVDLETPGLAEGALGSAILEAHFITTDAYGNVLGEGGIVPSYPENFLQYVVANMDSYCTEMHVKSGLLEELQAKASCALKSEYRDGVNEAYWMLQLVTAASMELEKYVLDVIFPSLGLASDHKLEMSGASVHFDRRWLARFTPRVEASFHYRDFDISSIRKAVALLRPDLTEMEPDKRLKHRARADILDAIAYYKWAQDNFFRTRGGN